MTKTTEEIVAEIKKRRRQYMEAFYKSKRAGGFSRITAQLRLLMQNTGDELTSILEWIEKTDD